jgi:hypothetical protein
MSNRYLGGVVRGIPLQFTPQKGNAANGIFTMPQYMQAIKARTWPIYDPYYGYNVLLLHGNGTNGAQNNTFLDSSTNNFTVTRNGNTTQGTFSPFTEPSGRWGVVFPADAADLRYTSNLSPGSSDFTMEFWVIPFSTSTTMVNWGQNAGSNAPGIGIGGSGNAVNFTVRSSAGTHSGSTSTNLSYTTWSHLALVRNNTSLVLYINGVASSTATITAGATVNTGTWYSIGILVFGATIPRYRGYMSNFRLNFNAVYTSNFTPPTEPLTVTGDTELLVLQTTEPSKDSAGNIYTFASNAGYELTPINPFSSLYPYDPAVNGGSGFFDGTGDYLTIADTAGLRFGTGNFTIQCWVYRRVAGATHTIAAKGGASTGWVFQITSGNVLRFTHTTSNIDSTITILAATWTHVAVVREGTGTNQLKLYINGVQSGQGTVSTNFTQTEELKIGADRSNANVMNGYISGFQYVVGTAETITLPTAPPTTGTVLLNFTNAGVIDNTGVNDPETVGNSQIDTSVKIMGDGSLECDGTGDWLLIPDNRNLQLRVSAFTIEFWVYLNTVGAAVGLVGKGGASTGWLVSLTSTNNVRFTYTASTITSTSTLAASTWYHIAVVREGTGTNQTRIYINGVQDGNGTVNVDFNQTEPMYVGANRTAGEPLNGYIDDLRITRYPRYTGSFSPVASGPFPSSMEPYQDSTVLLLPGSGTNGAQNNTFLDSSTNNFTITRSGNTTQGTFTPFNRPDGYWGNYFDGTGDYLNTSSTSTAFDLSSGDFTLEAWIYLASLPSAYTIIISAASTAGVDGGFVFGIDSSNRPYIGNGVVLGISGSTAVSANTWVHIAAVKNGANLQFYTNGQANGSAQAFSPNAAGFVYIGATPPGNDRITGYISNARVVKGTAVYTSNFTPPTTPLTAISGTSFLTCQSNRFVDNSSNNFAITRNGDVRVSPYNPFPVTTTYDPAVNGGSGYFDGSGDYLSLASNAAFAMGTGDFTIEFWFYAPTVSGGAYIVQAGTGAGNDTLFVSFGSSTLRLTTAVTVFATTPTLLANSWYHIAVQRSGNSSVIYTNGVAGTAVNCTTNFLQNGFFVGASNYNGYISNMRVVKGTAIYSSNFTPPTAPVTEVSGTSLLLNFTNAGIIDYSGYNILETSGNAQISTAVSKWGSGSMAFDGTGDYLIGPRSPELAFGTANFTIQFWVYANVVNVSQFLFDTRNPASTTSAGVQVSINSSAKIAVLVGTTAVIAASITSIVATTWTYIVITKNNGVWTLYINGVSDRVGGVNTTSLTQDYLTIGTSCNQRNTATTDKLNGYISDLRVLKGVVIPPEPFQTSQWQDV